MNAMQESFNQPRKEVQIVQKIPYLINKQILVASRR
jgi:hypothetical protein